MVTCLFFILPVIHVKSFPLSETVTETRAYINKGELGTPDAPTDKRKYIEEHGSFNACFSLNKRTVPSPGRNVLRKNDLYGTAKWKA